MTSITQHKHFPAALQAIRFILVGVINTLVDIIVYYVLTRYTTFFNDQILLTRILSFLSGSVCSFILNRLWTFKKRDAVQGVEVVKFYITVGISLLIGLAAMQLFVAVFHFYDLIALTLSIIFTFIWNFTISKFWVFRKKQEKEVQ
jgi:putative flippase GtrA